MSEDENYRSREVSLTLHKADMVMPPKDAIAQAAAVQLTLHEASLISPDKSEAEQAELTESIRELGRPAVRIAVNKAMQVVDGRHRLQALQKLGWAVKSEWTEVHDVSDAEAFALALKVNAQRRDLTKSQRAMMAALALTKERAAGGTPMTPEAAAKRYGVSKRNIYYGLELAEKDSELAKHVLQGQVRIGRAIKLAAGPMAMRDAIVQALDSGNDDTARELLARKDEGAIDARAIKVLDGLAQSTTLASRVELLVNAMRQGGAFDEESRAKSLMDCAKALQDELESGRLQSAVETLLQELATVIAAGSEGDEDEFRVVAA